MIALVIVMLYDLVLVPDGTAERCHRALIRGRWMAVDLKAPWFVEWWAKDGRAVAWHAKVPDLSFVLALAKYARDRRLEERVRVCIPKNATVPDPELLSQLHVEPI